MKNTTSRADISKITDYQKGYNQGKFDLKKSNYNGKRIVSVISIENEIIFLTGYLNSQGRSIRDLNKEILIIR